MYSVKQTSATARIPIGLRTSLRTACVLAAATGLAALAGACTAEELPDGSGGGHAFALQAATRGEDGREDPLPEGTAYHLWIVEGERVEVNGTAREGGMDTLKYSGTDEFGDHTYDFYAVTDGTTTDPIPDGGRYIEIGNTGYNSSSENIIPATAAPLPDLRHAELKNQTKADAGLLVLPFRHTLSRLKFQVVGQQEYTTSRITAIRVTDYPSGTFDAYSGTYTHTADAGSAALPRLRRTVYDATADGGEGILVTETLTDCLRADGTQVSALVFPTANAPEDTKVTVEVTVRRQDGTEFTTSHSIPSVGSILTEAGGSEAYKWFRLYPNHSYTLQLVVTSNRVSVVVVPIEQVDWTDATEQKVDTDNPTVFNGLQWAVANLGATTTDFKGEGGNWDDNIGFFYQYGRNIPYYVRKNHTPAGGKPTYRTNGWQGDPLPALQVIPYLHEYVDYYKKAGGNGAPGLDELGQMLLFFGQKVPTGVFSDNNAEPKVVYRLEQFNNFAGNIDPAKKDDPLRLVLHNGGNLMPWTTDAVLGTFWQDPANQPAPPGWRLPTADEWIEIFPPTRRAGDVCNIFGMRTCSSDVTEKEDKINTPHTEYENSVTGKDWTAWSEIIENDPAPGYRTKYLCRREEGKPYGRLFAIKKYKSPDAYRMMWHIWKIDDADTDSKLTSKRDQRGHHALRVYRFACPVNPAEDDIGIDKYVEAEWHTARRTSGIVLPVTGHVYRGGLIYYGSEACYGTSTVEKDKYGRYRNPTVRIKFNYQDSGDANGCYLFIRRDDYSNGRAFQVRLVRDIGYTPPKNTRQQTEYQTKK